MIVGGGAFDAPYSQVRFARRPGAVPYNKRPYGHNDPMFLRNQFTRDETFEMPGIKKTKQNLDNLELIGYDKLNEEKTFAKHITKYIHGLVEKGGGAAGGGGSSRSFPKFPGWDPAKSPGEGYEWRGKGEPGSKSGNWFNPETGEWLRGDLEHGEPIGSHWDYGIRGEDTSYRIFPDDSYSPKAFEQEGVVLK